MWAPLCFLLTTTVYKGVVVVVVVVVVFAVLTRLSLFSSSTEYGHRHRIYFCSTLKDCQPTLE